MVAFMGSSKKLKALWSLVKIIGLGVFFAFVTCFVFLNSFEIVFNHDTRFSSALERFQSKETLESILKENSDAQSFSILERSWAGDFGVPKTLKIPVFSSRLPLSEAISVNGEWLARSGNGHFRIISSGRNGNIGDVIVYLRSQWRTIASPEQLSIGDNIFLETDAGWRYMFRTVNKSLLRPNQPFVKSDNNSGTLILLIEDDQRKVIFAFEGVFVSIQNIQQ